MNLNLYPKTWTLKTLEGLTFIAVRPSRAVRRRRRWEQLISEWCTEFDTPDGAWEQFFRQWRGNNGVVHEVWSCMFRSNRTIGLLEPAWITRCAIVLAFGKPRFGWTQRAPTCLECIGGW